MYKRPGMKASTMALWNKGRKEIEGEKQGENGIISKLNETASFHFFFQVIIIKMEKHNKRLPAPTC